MSWGGHWRTVAPRLLGRPFARPVPPARPWSTTVADPRVGPVRLTGLLHSRSAADASFDDVPLLLVVHGLGGSAESPYARRAAAAAVARGWNVLRLNLRGADRCGEDFYHSALTADLAAALADDAVAAAPAVAILGFSLGGHVTLRYATEPLDPRVAAVAAVCAPLDLAGAADAIDRRALWAYRRFVLGGLKEIYAEVARRRPVPISVTQARRIATIREWDERIVAPRHGFAGAADYYAQASVAARLGALAVPALLVVGEEDPMVPPASYGRCLEPCPPRLEVRRIAGGGHLGFPATVDFGAAAPRALEPQLLAWLEERLGGTVD